MRHGTDSLLENIATTFGTPVYAYDGDMIRKQFASLMAVLPPLSLVCYAVKANSTLAILALLGSVGSGFDTVSEGELRRVRHVHPDLSKTLFSGVGKTAEEIRYALANNIRALCVESPDELAMISSVASAAGVVAPIALRINPNVFVDTHPYLATGLTENKFGIPEENLFTVLETIRRDPWLKCTGVTCHIGSGIHDVEAYKKALQKLISVADSFRTADLPIEFLDIGGGLGISFSGHHKPIDLPSLGEMLRTSLSPTPYSLVVEPGKFLVAESGTLITRVLYTKVNQGKRFAIVDAGMNDLIRPSLYDAHHHIDVLKDSPDPTKRERIDVVGPVCESGCYLARDRSLPPILAGDLLAVRDAGAYGFSMASNYNSRPRPAEVLLENGVSRLIRSRESYDELWRGELL